MQYLRCKCGKSESWTTDSTRDCEGCEECKTTYASHPNYHKELKPHTWKTKYNENTGKPYQVCSVCYQVDKESYQLSKED